MTTTSNQRTVPLDEDSAFAELTNVLPAGDRLRFAALGRIALLSAAKQKSLLRQEKALAARLGANAPEVQRTRSRLELEQRFDVAVAVEKQRTQATTVTRNPEALTLHGRVVNPQRLAVSGLTVSATDHAGKSAVFTATDVNGYYSLLVPAGAGTTDDSVTLLVSDRKKAVYYRGTECFAREPGKIHYRELVTGTTDPTQPTTPPPDVDPKAVTVPDVQGLREDVATAQMRAVGLAVESSTKESGVEDAGRVISQDPKPGVKVVPCSTVTIVVGAPPPAVDVPNVVGLAVERAQAVLEKSKFALGTISPAGSSSQAEVVKQTPAAGVPATPGTAVDLLVREPIATVTVPDVVESRLPAARKALDAAGLSIGKVDPADASGESVVATQAPAPGAQVKAGTAVNLVVREPAAKVTVPNVLRHDLTAARLTLEKSGLKIGKVLPADATEKSTVIRQSPAAGIVVPPGATVELAVKVPDGDPVPAKKAPKKSKVVKASTRKKSDKKK